MIVLAAERGLLVLDLTLRLTPRPGSVLVFLRAGDEEVGRLEIDLARLGLAPSESQANTYGRLLARDPARQAHLPDEVREEMRALIASHLGSNEVLWLNLSAGAGILAMLPWESWLTPLLPGPVLRLPYLMVPPKQVTGKMEVVVCSSMPEAKASFPLPQLLHRTVEQVVEAGLPVLVHVFVDNHEYAEVKHHLGPFLDSGAAVLYPPEGATPYGQAPRERGLQDEGRAIESPWLWWMRDELSNRRIDLALFFCHGFLSDGLGGLAFAESPLVDRDRHWARFVGARELSMFLDHIGAGGLGFASPPHNYSASALWALADEISRGRPGPALVFDWERDDASPSLGLALRFLFAGDTGALPAASNLTLYCHPNLLLPPAERSVEPPGPPPPEEESQSSAVFERILDRHESAINKMEREQAKTDVKDPTQEGREAAIEFVAGLFRKSQEDTSGGGGGVL